MEYYWQTHLLHGCIIVLVYNKQIIIITVHTPRGRVTTPTFKLNNHILLNIYIPSL